ncbi:MAG: serine hydrolase [Candidatus Hodarchaeales archaeon]
MKKQDNLMIILTVSIVFISGICLSSGVPSFVNESTGSLDFQAEMKDSAQHTKNFANLTGHGDTVYEVVFSPDDTILASCAGDGSVRLWNVLNGETIDLLQGHYFYTYSVDFSSDGTLLASANVIDKKINLWNVATGNLMQTWINAFQGLQLEFSTVDSSILAYPSGNEVIIRNVTDGTILHNMTGHTDRVWSVSFSPNGSLLASASSDHSIILWDVSSGLEMKTLNYSDECVLVDFSPDGSLLASASGNTNDTIQIWDISSGSLLQTLDPGDGQGVYSVAFSPTDSSMLVSSGDHTLGSSDPAHEPSIKIWNLTNGEVLESLVGHTNVVYDVEFSHDGTILASSSSDRTIKLWGDYPSYELSQTDDWPTSTPEAQGLNSTELDLINHPAHSLVIIRNEKLVYEKYYLDSNVQYTQDSLHHLFSVTKSFTATLFGIAIEEGFIQNLSQKVLSFFPEYSFDNLDSRKEAMSLYNLLTMTTGLDWNDGKSNIDQMAAAPDPIQYVLDRVMKFEPGLVFYYNSGASHVLSAIIQKTSGQTTLDFAMKYLFEPLGIEKNDVIWMTDSQGRAFGGFGLFLTPRNMAKLGQLYLNKGSWNGEQIVPNEWIVASTDDIEKNNYGYQWWVYPEAYSAQGFLGQFISVVPKKDLVVVGTSDGEGGGSQEVTSDVIDAIHSSSSTSSEPIYLMLASLIIIVLTFRRKKNVN